MVIDRARLKALPSDVVADMLARDELERSFLHLASLRHFEGIAERARPAEAMRAEAPGPEPATAGAAAP